ncbi:MAG: RCC1 domain-containing protein [Limisphaerales bacterium]
MKISTVSIASLALCLLSRPLSAGTTSGQVVGWGDNGHLETTGVPAYYQYTTGLVAIANQTLTNAVAISASYFFSLALKDDGTVFGWGSNHRGQAIGIQSSDLFHTNGLVRVAGQGLSNVTSIAAGGNFSLALRADGNVLTWGQNRVPAGLSNVVAIAACGFYSVALRSDGTVLSWCSTPPGQAHVPATLSNVVAVACGGGDYERSMALRRDGTVVVWKSGIPNEEPVPAEVRDIVAIAAGGSYSLALKRDGTVFSWGSNSGGQATGVPTKSASDVADSSSCLVTIGGRILSNAVAIAAAGRYSLALKGDGTVVVWGDERFYKSVPVGLSGVVAIAAGEGFCLAITTNHTEWPANR